MKKILLFCIPTSICNFRCSYCYLAQRPIHYQGEQAELRHTPEEFGKACSQKRLGGPCFANFCADGETLLSKDIDLYVKEFVKQGHYAEVVTNLTPTIVLDKFLSWDKELLKHLEFKCSFHYLELKKKGYLERFAENVNKIWSAGASATIEMVPYDELIPYIDEIKKFSYENFGSLPHITIARDDRTKGIDYLTNLPIEEYDRVWSQFDSDFWKFKKTTFGVKQEDFCHAGQWSAIIDFSSGNMRPCYRIKQSIGNLFKDIDKPLPEFPVGHCNLAHCFNSHALMTMGLIPNKYSTRYGDIRDRTKLDGTHWLQPELKEFFNTKLIDSNK